MITTHHGYFLFCLLSGKSPPASPKSTAKAEGCKWWSHSWKVIASSRPINLSFHQILSTPKSASLPTANRLSVKISMKVSCGIIQDLPSKSPGTLASSCYSHWTSTLAAQWTTLLHVWEENVCPGAARGRILSKSLAESIWKSKKCSMELKLRLSSPSMLFVMSLNQNEDFSRKQNKKLFILENILSKNDAQIHKKYSLLVHFSRVNKSFSMEELVTFRNRVCGLRLLPRRGNKDLKAHMPTMVLRVTLDSQLLELRFIQRMYTKPSHSLNWFEFIRLVWNKTGKTYIYIYPSFQICSMSFAAKSQWCRSSSFVCCLHHSDGPNIRPPLPWTARSAWIAGCLSMENDKNHLKS